MPDHDWNTVECGLHDLQSSHFFRTSQGNLTTVLRYLNHLGNKSFELLLGYVTLLSGCYESYLGISVLSINSPLIEKCGVPGQDRRTFTV